MPLLFMEVLEADAGLNYLVGMVVSLGGEFWQEAKQVINRYRHFLVFTFIQG